MSQAKVGDTVKVHYTGKFTDGDIFDSSDNREPLEFKIGSGMVIKGFEKGILGMIVGEKKTVEIPKEDAYGVYRPELAMQIKLEDFPEKITPEIGQVLHLPHKNGKEFVTIVTDITDDIVTVDANPPLADKDLVFDLELIEIK